MSFIIGVLGLQGAIEEHEQAILTSAEKLGVNVEIRRVILPEDLDGIDGLVMPGGESSAMRLIGSKNGMLKAVNSKILGNLPVFGTCAGAILLSKQVKRNENSQITEGAFPILDIEILRNGFGRQNDSFSTMMNIQNMEDKFEGIFIRAPRISQVGKDVAVLSKFKDEPVLVRQNNLLACTFHPELTNDTRIHELFFQIVTSYKNH